MECDMVRQDTSSILKRLSQICLAQCLLIAGGGQVWGAGIAAVNTDDFLSSLGVNTHVDQGVAGASCVEPLRYLGVRNIRDGGRNASQIILMHRQTGVRLDLLAGGGDPRASFC